VKWGSHTGAKQHLFKRPYVCVRSVCGEAYSGDSGIYLKSKRPKCKLCLKLEKKK
jgi:hypothetical protein